MECAQCGRVLENGAGTCPSCAVTIPSPRRMRNRSIVWSVWDQGEERRVQVRDLSSHEMRFVTRFTFALHSTVTMRLSLPGEEPPLECPLELVSSRDIAGRMIEYTGRWLSDMHEAIERVEAALRVLGARRSEVLQTRLSARRPRSFPVWSPDLSDLDAQSIDLSLSGVKILSSLELFAGETLSFVMELDDDSLPAVECMGTVIWYNSDEHTAGVRFEGLAPDGVEFLEDYLNRTS